MSYNPKEEAIKRSLELRKMYGAPANDHREVEFFFYANSIDNALDLLNKLRKTNYIVECEQRERDDGKYLITGNTTPINLQVKEMLAWSNQMYDLAEEFECEFDGWGALIEKEETTDTIQKLIQILSPIVP